MLFIEEQTCQDWTNIDNMIPMSLRHSLLILWPHHLLYLMIPNIFDIYVYCAILWDSVKYLPYRIIYGLNQDFT